MTTTGELPKGKYPNTFYRVSLKAIIKNKEGEVLCVKEAGSNWTLPGGGMDHGETIEQGLARELDEEVASGDTPFSYEPVGADTMFVEDRWQVWLIYHVTFSKPLHFIQVSMQTIWRLSIQSSSKMVKPALGD